MVRHRAECREPADTFAAARRSGKFLRASYSERFFRHQLEDQMGAAGDREVYDAMQRAVEQLVAAGMGEREAIAKITDAAGAALAKQGSRVAKRLVRTSPAMLEAERHNREAFERYMRKTWGKALDTLYMIGYGVAELADGFIREHGAAAGRDDVFVALVRLHERARRVFWEAHWLIAGGFPGGAAARARTLHELAVVSIVVGEHGRKPGSDLASRYLDHEVVGRRSQLKADLDSAGIRGDRPTHKAAAELRQLTRDVRRLTRLHGTGFDRPNGWATPLTQLLDRRHDRVRDHAPSFRELEQLAELSHLRGDYVRMSAEVHAGADGLALNIDPIDGEESVIGPTTIGLGEPGRLAAISLHTATWALVAAGEDDDETSIDNGVGLKAFESLLARYTTLARAAEKRAAADLAGGQSGAAS